MVAANASAIFHWIYLCISATICLPTILVTFIYLFRILRSNFKNCSKHSQESLSDYPLHFYHFWLLISCLELCLQIFHLIARILIVVSLQSADALSPSLTLAVQVLDSTVFALDNITFQLILFLSIFCTLLLVYNFVQEYRSRVKLWIFPCLSLSFVFFSLLSLLALIVVIIFGVFTRTNPISFQLTLSLSISYWSVTRFFDAQYTLLLVGIIFCSIICFLIRIIFICNKVKHDRWLHKKRELLQLKLQQKKKMNRLYHSSDFIEKQMEEVRNKQRRRHHSMKQFFKAVFLLQYTFEDQGESIVDETEEQLANEEDEELLELVMQDEDYALLLFFTLFGFNFMVVTLYHIPRFIGCILVGCYDLIFLILTIVDPPLISNILENSVLYTHGIYDAMTVLGGRIRTLLLLYASVAIYDSLRRYFFRRI